MSDGNWYYAQDGRQQGPVGLEALRQMAASGHLRSDDLVWTEGMAEWTPAGRVPDLQGVAAAVNPQVYPQTAAYPGAVSANQYSPSQINYYTPTNQAAYAGFWIRFCATFLDGLIVGIPLMLIMLAVMFAAGVFDDPLTGAATASPGTEVAIDLGARLVFLVVGWLYYALQESGPHMATIGKRVCGLVATDLNGNRLTFGRASGRYFGKILSNITCYIGYIMAAFTERKQGLHDMVAGTLVLQKQ